MLCSRDAGRRGDTRPSPRRGTGFLALSMPGTRKAHFGATAIGNKHGINELVISNYKGETKRGS